MLSKEKVSKAMSDAGSKIASELYDAQICKALGDSESWDNFIKDNISNPNKDLIYQYVSEEINSVTAIYIAMDRVKHNKA